MTTTDASPEHGQPRQRDARYEEEQRVPGARLRRSPGERAVGRGIVEEPERFSPHG